MNIIAEKGPSDIGLVAIVAGLVGWFVFTAGGTPAAAVTAAIFFTNSGAGAGGMIAKSIMACWKKGCFSFPDSLPGAVAGPSTITPASGYATPVSVLLIGSLVGVVCFYAINIPKIPVGMMFRMYGAFITQGVCQAQFSLAFLPENGQLRQYQTLAVFGSAFCCLFRQHLCNSCHLTR